MWEEVQDMMMVRSGRQLGFMLAAGAAGGVLGLLGAPYAVAAESGADLSLAKVGPTPTADGRLSYQITVTNNGPDASSGWTVTDPMGSSAWPGGPGDLRSSDPRCEVITFGYHAGLPLQMLECKGGPLAAGSSTVIDVTAANGSANYAWVKGNEPDSDSANNEARSVPIESSPLVDPVVGAGAAAVVLAAGGVVRLVRRGTTSA
ncbi:DUF11 domain-containing protein [Streptomyces sp. NPDC004629]|uniref:DUF11 domain-containing protein n=1 Tax=Streptomyces sp. NPDC004629 TaxID=3364705 RepID=UPI003688A16B